MSDIITGQIEALLPQYLAAKEAAEAAKEHQQSLADDLVKIMQDAESKTINTVWGSVTFNGGKETYKYDDVTLAQINLLQKTSIAEGKAIKKKGDPYISVRKS